MFTVIGDSKPTFTTAPEDVVVYVGQTKTSTFSATNSAGGYTVTIGTPVDSSTGAIPAFMTYASGTVTYAPTLFTQMATYTISVTLSDSYLTKTYSFSVQVLNKAPQFDASTVTSKSVVVLQSSTVTIPSYTDTYGNTVTLSVV